MSDSYSTLHAAETDNDTAAAVVAGIEIAGPRALGASERFLTQLVPAGAKTEVFDLEQLEDARALYPRRKTGIVHVQDASSFVAYLEKHELPCTEVYADLSRMKLVGVINSHEESTTANSQENLAGHRDHRVSLELLYTDAWKAWVDHDKKLLGQVEFAEHLEDHASDVVTPAAADMLEIAQSLLATTSVDFKSAQRLSSGEVGFRYQETTTATAGQNGELEIPTEFVLALAPFEGTDPVEITARFRYRLSGGNLRLSYALLDPSGVARRAFLDHVDHVAAQVDCPVFRGRPE